MDNPQPQERPKRALSFLLYDRDGICDESTLHTIQAFREHVDFLLVVSNGALQEESRSRLEAIADVVLERENIGYDVGAYRDAFEYMGWDRLAQFDELLMVNYTFFGPVGSFGPVLARMSSEDIDFWGISDHASVTPHPYLGKGTMPAHLQSFWLTLKNPVLADPVFKKYWMELKDPVSYSGVVAEFESQFTQHFADLGYRWAAAYPCARYGVDNPSIEAPLALLLDGCPIFKKRIYFHDAPWLAQRGVFSGAVTAEAVERGFPEELILDGVRRRATVRELSFGMDAMFVVPGGVDPDVEAGRVAIVEESPWKTLLEGGVQALMGSSEVLIVDTSPPRPGELADGGLLSSAYARAAIVESGDFIKKVLREHPRLAALYPYTDILREPVRGRGWFAKMQASRRVAGILGLKEPFSISSVVAPYRSVAAYRRGFLEDVERKISEVGGWDALQEAAGVDANLTLILDLLSGDIAKNLGSYVGQVATRDEVRRSASLLQDSISRASAIHPDYVYYPYGGRVIAPSRKNRIGMRIKNASPEAFEFLYSLEKRVRVFVARFRPVAE